MNKFFGLLFFSLLIFLQSCEKPDYRTEFGNSVLFIPQSIVQSGGSDNNYAVTVNSSGVADTSIAIGLYRSGLELLSPVTVDLTTDVDTLQKAIQIAQDPAADSKYNIFKQAKLLPAAYYSVPGKISLENNQRDAYVSIKIDKAKLLNDPDFGPVKYILPMRISNPTRYSINSNLGLVMFIFSKGK